MKGMLIPEAIVQDALQKGIDALRKNYVEQSNKEESILALFAGQQKLGEFDAFNELKNILIDRDVKDPKFLKINHSYTPDQTDYPGVYVNLISDDENETSLGIGEGDHSFEGDAMFFTEDNSERGEIYSKRYQGMISIIVISENKNESIVLYHLIKNLLISLQHHINAQGVQEIKHGSNNPMLNNQIPNGVFLRVVTIRFKYESYSHSLTRETFPTNYNVLGKLKIE